MIGITIPRLLKYGLLNFWRNIGLSVATVFVMLLTLFLVGTLFTLNLLGGDALESVEERVDISVYFNNKASDAQIIEVEAEIKAIPEVREVSYVTKDEALKRFQEEHADNPLIATSVEELGENPLQASIVVNAHDPSDYEKINNDLQSKITGTIIERVNFEDNRSIIARLDKSVKWIRYGGVFISLLFAVIAVLVIYNTVRLTIHSRREEISIMKLVGASNAFIRIPFLIEGILYGIAASIITFILLFPILKWLSPRVTGFLGAEGPSSFEFFAQNAVLMLLLLLGVGVVLGSLSSAVAIRRYLKEETK